MTSLDRLVNTFNFQNLAKFSYYRHEWLLKKKLLKAGKVTAKQRAICTWGMEKTNLGLCI